ncbi:MAG: hypothetical protein COS85_24910 [Armatimonadetes bacterium CG07_land_8_20_14_0_80_59_28]|nr:MAG: hypothetical protein COS85_24910 [Armatimonadetes bacterium CG07_land_8_20_14_0_80_59_28]PIY39733.1 MAG: hypothetical protein COZ05_18795 [Armatimonadetes bacterium CG_4_10_14_3_um_filter_59_10]PJB78404.1 MAG: hypothetical protein CO095_00520 [Armatimonadetes bacterium CG_4_9_14_3_um_filter_58_7]
MMTIDEIPCASSVDGTAPLVADAAYTPNGTPKPLVAVMHGYSGGRTAVAKDLRDFAARGLFAIAPDMRGRGDSAGKWDSGGLDVHDIVDGILAAIREFPREIDANNISIVGYSGGGGNCFAAMTRFPDLFHVVAPFFGISDYGLWYETCGREDCNRVMVETLGGTPEEIPDVYLARNACLAAGNNGASKLHIFWDEEETQCPPVLNENFIAAYHAAGHSNAAAHISRVGDEYRWRHGYRVDNPMLEAADDIICDEVFSPPPDLSLPLTGTLTVCGYLVTRHFQVVVEDGQRGAVEVGYDLRGPEPVVDVLSNPGEWSVSVSPDSPLSLH